MPASIEIRNFVGDVETRSLSRTQPLSIGRHRTNDICIDEEDVAVLHCRISWNKSAFEVVAANPQGVEVNGTLVQNSPLMDGDVVSVGSIDITMRTDEASRRPTDNNPTLVDVDSAHLKPISEDRLFNNPYGPSPARAPVPAEEFGLRPPDPEPAVAPQSEKRPKNERRKKKKEKRHPDLAAERIDNLFVELEAHDAGQRPTISRRTDYAGLVEAPEETAPEKPRSLRGRPLRPGEQDALRSPLVLGLGAGALTLLLAAATIYLVIGRESSQNRYDDAVLLMNEGKYTQAIKSFEEFIQDYPRHELTQLARLGLEKSRIEQQISGATPAWERGLGALQDLIERTRDQLDFPELQEAILQFAGRIALGSAQAAEASRRREFLAISADASRILERYAPVDNPPRDLQAQIARAVRQADQQVVRRETYDAALAKIEEAIAAGSPLEGLEIRRQLLNQFPDLKDDQKLAGMLERMLDSERDGVARAESELAPVTEDFESAAPRPLSLALHLRARTDEGSLAQTVFVLAKDCCYGIDDVTGEPLWRRVIGLDSPFFPVPVATSVAGLLLYDTNHEALLLVDQRTGALVWRQAFAAGSTHRASGPPLIHQGQIYFPTTGNELYQVDADSGSVATKLSFRQPLLAPPVLDSSGQRMFVAGDRDVVYTLAFRPLACTAVSYVEHQAGSIGTSMLSMGSLLLVCENDRQDSGRLRVLDARPDQPRLAQVAESRLDGQIESLPIMYGNRLLVPYGRERIAAFSATDEAGKEPLKLVARHQESSSYAGTTYLLAGPDEIFWLAGSSLQRFRVKIDAIEADPRQLAVGLSTQPLQMHNRYLYTGRRLPFSGAVLFTQADRDEMTSNWRTVLGSSVLSLIADGNRALAAITEAGDVFRVTSAELQAGGFKKSAALRLEVAESATEPLRVTAGRDGRAAIAVAGPQPQLCVVNSGGQAELRFPLEAALEAEPVQLATGIVLPLPGKLRLARTDGGPLVEDYLPTRDMQRDVQWKFLVAVDEDELLAVDTAGLLSKIQFREAPVPHLAEVTSIALEQPVDTRPVVMGDKLWLACADGKLLLADVLTLETLEESSLSAPASNALWTTGGLAFVEIDGRELACFVAGAQLQRAWTCPLSGDGLAGPPLAVGDDVVFAERSGLVRWVASQDGVERGRLEVGQPLTTGPLVFGESIVVGSIDGSLYRLDLQGNAQQ